MKTKLLNGGAFTFLMGCGFGIVFCAGLAIGLGIGNATSDSATSESASNQVDRSPLFDMTPEMVLRADAAAGGEKVSLATGEVTGGMDAIFALDNTTGDLFCWVVSPKTGGFLAKYMTNVQEHLAIKKGEPADYVMTTGRVDVSGVPRQGNARPAESVCYVADGNTGRMAGFAFMFSSAKATQGGAQWGPLTRVCADETRGNIQRD